ncbi:MAG: chemotaxis protein methyltransferase CheR [Rhodocyclales bacterium]|nr:chemotaxis protein methyltransferase CheR [Rhodocyclales bacterium]MDB5889078.1 chemotaxis protein methyltransferase CheR [Rhodocyclales bacterium]
MHDARARRSLGYRLFLLAAAGVVPLAVLATFAVYSLMLDRQHEAQRTALDLSRALATAVDAELHNTMASLDGLVMASQLDQGDIVAFGPLAQRTLIHHPHWLAVILSDEQGHIIFKASSTENKPSLKVLGPDSLQQVMTTRAPAVGGILLGPQSKYSFAIRVPVFRDARLRYVVSAAVVPDAIANVISRQKVPASWVVSVFDQHGLRVARSRQHDKYIGTQGSPSLRKILDTSASEGSGESYTLEGDASYSGFSRLSDSGWTVVTGIPRSEVFASAYQSLMFYGTGIAASFALCAFLAFLAARRISKPIDQLLDAADALGRGKAFAPLSSEIQELDALGAAMNAAASERAHAEAERDALQAAERDARQHAEQASKAKDEFLAMLGHELRNPLAPISTALELIRMRGNAQIEPFRQIIKRQVTHMTRLVDDLLDVSRIAAGRIELHKEAVDINRVVEQALEATAPLIEKRDMPVAVSLSTEPVWVEGEDVRLVQVVTNLLTNALKFTPHGRIGIAVQRVGSGVEIRVQDAGIGISPELLPHVFELFSQGPQPLERHTGGLGLGLSIVKSLVEMHGGAVTAQSAGIGQGSCFAVTLPMVERRHAVPAVAPVREMTPASGRLLVVDDNVDAADTTAMALAAAGYEVRAVHDPIAALNILNDFSPDIAILDIGLPGMDGYQLAAEMRAHPRWSGARLIALTGYGQQADRDRAAQVGFAAYLTKPVEPEILRQTVARLTVQMSGVISGSSTDLT